MAKNLSGQKVDRGTEAVAKYLESFCPSCINCPVEDECLALWDTMTQTPLTQKQANIYKMHFKGIINKKRGESFNTPP
jgi:adenine-specific DNA glycosylase